MVNSDHPAVVAFAREHAQGATDRERAVALYYAVRDGFRYDPYSLDLTPKGMQASTVLETGLGWCVPKATLLTAVCRAAGIPARLGYADVRNHLSTERMRQSMQTDVFVWHGFSDIWLDGAWQPVHQWRDQFLPKMEWHGDKLTTDQLRIKVVANRQGYGSWV
ncbi:MAG TPA: transglutaminase-like domain-containing protein, partial [Rhodoferax sp.]|nr:transglutaminase-like domain-containing protein [Rhodoferax sp.]